MHATASPNAPAGTAPIRVAVDLSNLRPGGENGGVKPFLFETLLWLGRQGRAPLQFLYLTCSRTHEEVRDGLARLDDELICVRDNGGPPPRIDGSAPHERLCVPPPADLLWQLGARVIYCPFGKAEFASPGVCTICTVVDVLHRDFPWSLSAHHVACPGGDVPGNRRRGRPAAMHLPPRCRPDAHTLRRAGRTHVHHAHRRAPAVRHAARTPARRRRTPTRVAPAVSSSIPANAWKHKNHETLLLAYGIYRAGARWPRGTFLGRWC